MINKKSISILSLCLVLAYLLIGSSDLKIQNYDYDVTIYRDNWGVPHIYGKKDTDTAFGLAYAHSEDDFETLQDVLLALRGKLASVKGRESAPVDYLVGMLKVWETVDKRYDSDLSQEVKNLCAAYADGVNLYMEKHPHEIVGDLYPVTGKDIVAGFVFRVPLMFDFDWYLKELMKDTKPEFKNYAETNTEYSMYGSNMIAVNGKKSSDGHTRLAINSHQPWEGPVTWYEVHLNSEEGLNVTGGLFPGSPVVFKGYNDYLGWSHTVNGPDLIDVYELTINPENEDEYLLDGNWLSFEKDELPINVKLWGPINWTFKRELLWSNHGPVIKADHGVYALRYAGSDMVGQLEQWFKMNKSSNLEEFTSAMEMMQIPMFNTLYADKLGNIYYVYNGLIPIRDLDAPWYGILPGDKSELIWNKYYDYDMLPQVLNPDNGYLQNCNSTPYLATVGNQNPKKILPDNAGIEDFQTNRAYRANELYGGDISISKDEFYQYKYDTYYSKNSVMNYALNRFLSEVSTTDSLLLKGVSVLENWDMGNQKENTGAALALLTFKLTYNIKDFTYDYESIMERFKESVYFLIDKYGKIDIPLGDLQVIKRGDIILPLDGGPDILRAVYSKMIDNERVARHGDCFFQMVDWDENGNVTAESIHQYGSATLDKESPHYADQAYLFSQMKMKPSFIELDSIKKYLNKSYNPLD
ncbi:MAG: hypothetical protein CBE33_03710 [Candidatus Pelagibacter sp. TMED273]|nr:MAG: hypothetical protein CBE33_03710 [Candidatus Pelagibacter sp. TMED273]